MSKRKDNVLDLEEAFENNTKNMSYIKNVNDIIENTYINNKVNKKTMINKIINKVKNFYQK